MRVTTVYYVNCYEVTRVYGGSEEGGWWFDVGTFVEPCAMFTEEDEANAYARALQDEHEEANREAQERGEWYERPLHSVLCTGVTRFLVEATPGHDWPDERPYYE